MFTVGSTYKDPLRCWTDNAYGPNGYGVGIGLGVAHIIRSHPDVQLDSVPGDYTVNTLLTAIPDVAKQLYVVPFCKSSCVNRKCYI